MLRNVIVLITPFLALGAQGSDDLSKALELQRSGKLELARAQYERARSTAAAQNDTPSAVTALAGIAQIDLALGHYADCIAEAGTALRGFHALSRSSDEGRILTTRGQARFYAGDSGGALTDFQQALQFASKRGDREQEITTLNNIGSVYFGQGRYGEALQQYQLAATRVSAATAERWYPTQRQLTNANLAVLYQRVGQYSRALDIYKNPGSGDEALPVRERAQMLANMGTLYRRLGDPVSALERYREAEQLFHKAALLAGEVGVLNDIGIAQMLDFSNPGAAAQTFTEALMQARQSGGKRLVMTSLLYRGEALLRTGKLPAAKNDFASASRMAADLNADEAQWKADYGLARVADREGDLHTSNDLLRGCVSIIERLRRGSSTPSGRTGFLIERREVYDLLIEHEAAHSSAEVASVFELMEQSRARDLQDRTRSGTSALGDLQQRLPADTLILEYWVGERSLAVISISRSGATLLYRPVEEAAFRLLSDLPAALADPRRRDWESPAAAAGTVLLNGIVAIQNPGLRHLIVVPDGMMARIPFEALPVKNDPHRMLIDRFSVSYLPFAGAFRTGVRNPPFYPPWKKTIEAFADPVPNSRGELPVIAGEDYASLPQARTEIEHASEGVGGRAELHVGSDARKTYLTRARGDFPPLLHFATHAFADPEDPERSYVLFAPAGANQSFDYLFLREASGLPLKKVKLVTVSACDSGAGKFTRGEGIQSFGSAFLAAGAQAVLTSLWRAGDRSTEELMTRFYDLLEAGKTAAEALREAKLEFRRANTSASHPAYWAGFILTGDSEVRVPRTISWKLAMAALAALAMVVASAILRSVMIRRQAETE